MKLITIIKKIHLEKKNLRTVTIFQLKIPIFFIMKNILF